MWKIDRDDYTFTLISAFDQFVDEFFAWVLENKQKNIQILELEISRKSCRITKLAKKTKLKDYLIQFCNNNEVDLVASLYTQYKGAYSNFPETGVTLPTFEDETKQLVETAFNYFYEQLIDTLTFQRIYLTNYVGLPELKQEFRKHIGETHPICPYCDCAEIDLLRFSSIDHFFPKKKYALLAIYSDNLILACSACNDRIKGDHIITPIFHPYFYNPHDYLLLSFDVNYEIIEFSAKTEGFQQWVENFKNSFNLDELYNKRIKVIHNETSDLRGKVKRAFRNYKKYPRQNLKHHLSDEELMVFLLRNHIKCAINKNKKLKGREPYRKFKIDFYEQLLDKYIENENIYLLNLVS